MKQLAQRLSIVKLDQYAEHPSWLAPQGEVSLFLMLRFMAHATEHPTAKSPAATHLRQRGHSYRVLA